MSSGTVKLCKKHLEQLEAQDASSDRLVLRTRRFENQALRYQCEAGKVGVPCEDRAVGSVIAPRRSERRRVVAHGLQDAVRTPATHGP